MLTEIKERRPPLDTDAAAIYTSTKSNYLEKLRCNGDGPVFIKRNGLVRYDPDDLDAWLEAGKKRSTSDNGDAQYALVSGDRVVTTKFGAKPDLADANFHPAGYTPADGDRWIPIVDEDSQPFDKKLHWRLVPPSHRVEPDRMVRLFRVVEKSWEHA
jgi:hypothetical protein